MSLCTNCGNPIPEEAKFCPVCGTPVPAAPVFEASPAEENPAAEDAPAAQEAPSGSWYQSTEEPTPPPAAPVFVKTKPAIGSIFDFYRKAFAILAKKPIKLWGLSLLYLFIASLIASLGAALPLVSLPIVLLLGLGFTGVLLNGYHGMEVHSEQLFQGFKKDQVVRNAGGLCWKELWTLIWGFVPVMNIIKAYSYCFVPYILLTDKDIPATEALRKSMRMTDGYKGKMFGADVLLVVGFILAMIILVLFSRIRYIGWIFGIACFLLYLAVILFFPIFLGLVRTAFFEEISKVHED